MDWYSRKVLSWEVSNTMEDTFCISALESAIRLHGSPEIFNTDQGSQFTSTAFIDVLKQNDIKISMGGKGRWMDSVKYEDVYLKDYRTVVALKQGLSEYFRFYNDDRPHQSFDGFIPAEKCMGAYTKRLHEKQPMDMWTRPQDQPAPFGTYGQAVAKKDVIHRLTTLAGFATTYPQAQ